MSGQGPRFANPYTKEGKQYYGFKTESDGRIGFLRKGFKNPDDADAKRESTIVDYLDKNTKFYARNPSEGDFIGTNFKTVQDFIDTKDAPYDDKGNLIRYQGGQHRLYPALYYENLQKWAANQNKSGSVAQNLKEAGITDEQLRQVTDPLPITSTGNTNMAEQNGTNNLSPSVLPPDRTVTSENIQEKVEDRAGATTLPTGTTYTPEKQQVQDNELLQTPASLAQIELETSKVPTTGLEATVPQAQTAATYSANTVDGTPEAVAAQGKLSSESVIGDIQGTVGEQSVVQAAQGEVSEQSTVKYQLEQLFSSFEEGKPLPAWAAPAVRNVGSMMQARGLGSSSMASAAITQAIMEAGIPIAKADADRHAGMDLANLNNMQQSVLQNAMTYASMDKANLDARMQAAVNNAKSFLTLDTQNLTNEQQMATIDYQGQLQQLTSNQAAENAAAQFNAQSQNQIDEFFAELGSQIETTNLNRVAAQNQFNVNEENAMRQFKASADDARERFNTEMAVQISQANAQWRREINTANTANQNAANQLNAQNLLGVNQSAMDALWQRYRDEAGWALQIAQAGEQRFHEIGLLGMEIDANTENYKMQTNNAQQTELGKAILNGIFNVGKKWIG